MYTIMKFLCILFVGNLITISNTSYVRPDEQVLRVTTPEEAHGKPYFLDTIGLAQKYGYYAEKHFVTTEDGYILEIFRIPGSPVSPKAQGKPVVLVQHGLFAVSDVWAFYNRSISYFLADAGYDVWLGNFRGNTYSRSHVKLSPEGSSFWNFTFHELGKYDYPAMIDYILNLTNKPTLTLIGHSMGGTTLVILLSERPEYNKKVHLAVALAPSVYWKKNDPVRSFLLGLIYSFKDALDPTGMSEFLPQSTLGFKLFDVCKKYSIIDLCLELIGLLSGYDPVQMNQEDVFEVIYYFPSGSSTKCVWHYCQHALNGGKFRLYDYERDNYLHYGQSNPPNYKVKNIVTNMAIIYGENDPFSTREDNEELAKRVSTKALLESVDYPRFSHLDFVLAKDIRELLHNRVLEIISEYPELTQQFGYQSEEHSLTTEDGYTLKIFRIQESPSSPKKEGKPVVLLQHGMGVSSNIWGLFNRSLAYTLADAGFDVWLGNYRGNTYGRSHNTLTPGEPSFWNFSWNEIGRMDFAATIDYILKTTNKETLTLIGHSMGGTGIFVLLSERPEYNKKVNVAVAMAPSVFWTQKTPVKSVIEALYSRKQSIDPNGMSEIMAKGTSSMDLMNLCMKHNIMNLCLAALEIELTNGSEQTDMPELLSVMDQLPAGTSTKCMWHYAQLAENGKFRKYDYGESNQQYYGQSEPPDYQLNNIQTNMIIIYSNNDPFCSKDDLEEVVKRVSTKPVLYEVEYPKFSHTDFIAARDLKTLLNDKVVSLISKYQE
ncbi:uncharacterized protein [Chelonus insularis]|uniref:uncharacterized protein n=1 Tax=Chelonus insularis TaxID=460826 RepID=UPI001589FCFA|nr:uncharacterized protein LOC118074841 [Chelonus insularis]